MARKTIQIDGMSCQHCVMRVKKAIEGLHGVQDLDVRIGSADVTFDESKVREKDIEDAVTKAGYKVRS